MGKCIILCIRVYVLTIRASVAMDNSWFIASVFIYYNITKYITYHAIITHLP